MYDPPTSKYYSSAAIDRSHCLRMLLRYCSLIVSGLYTVQYIGFNMRCYAADAQMSQIDVTVLKLFPKRFSVKEFKTLVE